MSLTENRISTPDDATLALWSAAETGNVEQLLAVLPRVRDINARNEHGVTALMRAAQHGRVRVVRVLLERGADANIVRNDKFTALALAAFFGHTEVVRALMEHGADSQASTRHDTSPHMWATARTFKRVVNELENPAAPSEKPATIAEPPLRLVERTASFAEQPAPSSPRVVEPVSKAVARSAAASTVVRTLKDPPEIWDLVHPAPKGFDARSAFVSHLSSMRSGFVFRAATVIVLACVCAVGVWVLRSAQARSEVGTGEQPNAATVVSAPSAVIPTAAAASAVVPTESAPSAAVSSSEPTNVATLPGANVDASITSVALTEKPVTGRRRWSRIKAHDSEPSTVATTEVSQPAVAPAPKTAAQTRTEPVPTTASKNSAPLSPQLIAPVKSTPSKAKVIQWP